MLSTQQFHQSPLPLSLLALMKNKRLAEQTNSPQIISPALAGVGPIDRGPSRNFFPPISSVQNKQKAFHGVYYSRAIHFPPSFPSLSID